MMAEDAIGQKLSRNLLRTSCPVEQQLRPGGGVIDADVFALQHPVKGRVMFAEVVPGPRDPRCCLQPDLRTARRRKIGRRRQVLRQGLPVAAVGQVSGMGEGAICHQRIPMRRTAVTSIAAQMHLANSSGAAV